MNPRLAVVVVHWNGSSVLEELVRSLTSQTCSLQWRLIVVDNASRDTERVRLEAVCDAVRDSEILWCDENLGFAGGANVGVQRAIESGSRWVLLTTQDTIFEPSALEALWQAVLGFGGPVLAGPVVLDRDTGRVLSRGECVSMWHLAVPGRWMVREFGLDRAFYRVHGLLGCTLFFSGTTWQRLGGFWEPLFAYYEEVDLALRARQLGIPLVVVPAARVHHRGWRGFRSGMTPLSAELKARNLLLVFRRHARWYHYPLILPMLSLLLGSCAAYAARLDWAVARAIVRGAIAGCRGEVGPLRSSRERGECASEWA